MKRVFAPYPRMLLLIGMVTSSVAAGGQIDIRIDDIASDVGMARIVLMTGIEEYTGQRPVTLTKSLPIQHGVAHGRIDVPPGTYVIIAHHDRDADDTLNRPLFALPIEPYGYSNGAWTSLGLPDFDDVAFDVGDDVIRQHIQLRTNALVTLARFIAVAAVTVAIAFVGIAFHRRYHYRRLHSS